jgi:nicotinamidase-related amidase
MSALAASALRALQFLNDAKASSTSRSLSVSKTGLNALLRPEDSIVLLIDHQPYQFTNLNSHEATTIVNNVVGLAKGAKVFNVPTILTTVIEERGGYIIKQLQDVYPDQKPINRTWINTWQDPHVTDIVKKSGRKQLVLAALWTEACLAQPAIQRSAKVMKSLS